MLGQPPRYRGEFGRAQRLLWQSVKLRPAANDPGLVGVALSSLGEVARDAGRPVQARRLYGVALRRHAALGNKRHLAYELEGLAAVGGPGARRGAGPGLSGRGPGAAGTRPVARCRPPSRRSWTGSSGRPWSRCPRPNAATP